MAQIAPWDLADGGACLIRLVWPSAGYAGHAGYAWPSAGQVGINVLHARLTCNFHFHELSEGNFELFMNFS